jgi:hypothetical protein
MSTYRVVTVYDKVPTQDYYCLRSFHASLARQGISPLVLSGFRGLATKPREVWMAITTGTVTEEIIIIVDSWDLVFQRSVDEMVEKFKQQSAPVIISAEINCFPVDYKSEFDAQKDDDDKAHHYINSGFIMGYTPEVKKMLDAMDASNLRDDYYDAAGWHHFNDQTDYMKVFLEQPVQIKMDKHSEYSVSIYGMSDDDFSLEYSGDAPVVRNKINNNEPFVLHWNGGAKSLNNMKVVLKHLNLL